MESRKQAGEAGENEGEDQENEKKGSQHRQNPGKHFFILKSRGVVDEVDLSKVQALTLRQVKWIKCMLESRKLAENKNTNGKPNTRRLSDNTFTLSIIIFFFNVRQGIRKPEILQI